MAVLLAVAVLGLALLTLAADQLVVGSARLATRLRIDPVVVGVVVIGTGTSVPEFLVSGVAAARGDLGLAVGNLAGSNLVNVTLILGVAGLVGPVRVRSSVIRREAPLSVAAVCVFAVAVELGLGWVTGTVLAVLALLTLVVLVRLTRVTPAGPLPAEVLEHIDEPPPHRLGVESVRTLVGLLGTLAGAELLVSAAGTVALRWGVPPAVVGFTLVAIGTSLPELTTAVQAARRNEGDLVVGNLLGSNLVNSLVGGGLVGLVAVHPRPSGVTPFAIASMVGASLLSWLCLGYRGRLRRLAAVGLVAAYLAVLPLLG